MYAYETTLKNLTDLQKKIHVAGHKYYAELYEQKIEFYRSGMGVTTMSDILKKRKKENDDMAQLFGDYDDDHEFDIDEVDENFGDDEDIY